MLPIPLSFADLKGVRKGVPRTNTMRTKASCLVLLVISFSAQLVFKVPVIVRTPIPLGLGLASQPEPIILADFSEFLPNVNHSNIKSTNYIDHLYFSLVESFPSQPQSESYLLSTEKWGNIYKFTLNMSVLVEYRREHLGKVFVELSSRYSERDYYRIIPSTKQRFPLVSCEVLDDQLLNDGVIQLLGYPDDTLEMVQIDNNNLFVNDYYYTNTLLFQMKRTQGILTCTIRNGTDSQVLLAHEWNASVAKPLNYILLGYFTEPNELTEYFHVNFFDFRAVLSPPASPPPSYDFGRWCLFYVVLGLLAILIYWNKKRSNQL